MSDYGTTGCPAVVGVVSIVIGAIVLVAAFPVGALPAAGFIGGGLRLIWSSGAA